VSLSDIRIYSYGTRFSGCLRLGIILGTLGLGMVVGRWYGICSSPFTEAVPPLST
jgi:hypothetical protein